MTIYRSIGLAVLLLTGATGCAGSMEAPSSPTDPGLITLERAVHFQSPDAPDVIAGPGKYRVEATAESGLRLIPDTGGSSLRVHALHATHELSIPGPVAFAIPRGEDEQHVVLVLPGGKSLDAAGSFSGIHGRGTAVPISSSVIQQTVVQQAPTVKRLQDSCALGKDPQPAVTRWMPFGRVWPGGKIVFEGQNLDASRFQAVVGSPRIALTIVSASSTRIETLVPSFAEGGPYSAPAGEALTVSYRGTIGCKVLNPAFIVTDAFTVATAESGGPNGGYSWIRHQMNLTGEIEGARSVTILPQTDASIRSLVPDTRTVCDWVELKPSGRGFTLLDNRIHQSLFGFFRDHRNPVTASSVPCKLPVKVVILDPFNNISQDQLFIIPMTIRTPRTVNVDTGKVFHTFQGVTPSLPPFGPNTGAMGDCGKLFAGSPAGDPQSTIGVTIQNYDWVFSIKSGVTPTICRFNSVAVEANLGVAFGPFIGWDVTKAGDPTKCTAQPSLGSNGQIGILHRLESMQVYLSCDPGPLGDNRVTIRGTSINLLVPHEYMPPAVSLEVQN